MKITGIKHGNTIELSENPNIPDGTQVVIEVKQVETMTIEEKLEKMKEFLARPWEGREDFLQTMAEIEREPQIAVTHLPNISQEEQIKRNQAVIELLRQWREEGDEQEQIETAEYLRQVLDEDRLSNRPLLIP